MNGYEFVTARFADNEKNTVEALWVRTLEDGTTETVPEYVEAKETDASFKIVLSHISLDELHSNTVRYMKNQRLSFENAIKSIAERDGLNMKGLQEDDLFNLIIDTISKEITQESLFKFKLKMFDVSKVKTCEDRSMKAAIRKAETIAEAIAAYSKI